ncbi:uncharacterized protein LOC119276650 isoform X1 [Triticum dicoccoides]|uniref:uncharacterized protein LOC119276650 isoform X1 n=1 Tax=Triticum dicoccoides TaxID=85692 RepID=UPI000E7A7770|nr:uncharacterized protein LOC119276650 isoform X1 [Triticum dicoccoides]
MLRRRNSQVRRSYNDIPFWCYWRSYWPLRSAWFIRRRSTDSFGAQAEVELHQNSLLEPLTQTKTGEVRNDQSHSLETSSGLGGKLPDPMMKLKIPKDFAGDAVLSGSEWHHFLHAKDLQTVVNETEKWLSGKLSLALLQNGPVFAIEGKDVSDMLFQNGAVCVVRNDQLSEVVITRRLYSNSITATLRERQAGTSEVSDIKITKTEFGGNGWTRRKYSIEGDDGYHVFQWRPRESDSKLQTKPKQKAKVKHIQDEVAVPPSPRVEPQIPDFSLSNCISIATAIPELSPVEKANTCDIFRDDVNRQIFVCADQETRLAWLRKQMAPIPD